MTWHGHLLSILTYLLTLLFVPVLLRSRRTPASTLAWLTAIAFAPYIGVPLFLLIGGRKLGSTPRNRKAAIHDEPPPAVANEAIEWLETGERAYLSLRQHIREARSSIDLETFILKNDEVGVALVDELRARAAEGIPVRILLDALGSNRWVRPSLKAFEAAGGKVAFFSPLLHAPFRGALNLRNHRKMALFDGRRAWFGGMNLGSEYMSPTPVAGAWQDLALTVQGALAGQLMHVFESDWAFAVRSADPVTPEGATGSRASVHLARTLASGPDVEGDPLYDTLVQSCFDAGKRLWIATPYFVPDALLSRALELACRRGVDVRVLVPERSNHRAADLSRGSYLRQLQASGGRALLFPRMLHAKLVIVDDTYALTGSANFDMRSLWYNYEVGVFLQSPDDLARAARWMEERFAEAVEKSQNPGFFLDLAEGVGRLFGPLL